MQLETKDFEEIRYFIPVNRSRERNRLAGRAADHHQMGYNAGHGFANSGLLQLAARTGTVQEIFYMKLRMFVNIFILASAMT